MEKKWRETRLSHLCIKMLFQQLCQDTENQPSLKFTHIFKTNSYLPVALLISKYSLAGSIA